MLFLGDRETPGKPWEESNRPVARKRTQWKLVGVFYLINFKYIFSCWHYLLLIGIKKNPAISCLIAFLLIRCCFLLRERRLEKSKPETPPSPSVFNNRLKLWNVIISYVWKSSGQKCIFQTKNKTVTFPTGILYGTMTLELGGTVSITCEKTGYSAALEFKLKVGKLEFLNHFIVKVVRNELIRVCGSPY